MTSAPISKAAKYLDLPSESSLYLLNLLVFDLMASSICVLRQFLS